jgi:hypothetical protein
MNDRQKKILKKLSVKSHLARSLGMGATQLNLKLQALAAGKQPTFGLRKGNPQLFEPAYIAAQWEFFNDLVAIASEQMKEMELES